MKLRIILKAVLTKIVVILFFAGIYYYLREEFEHIGFTDRPTTLYDCINLSTTIQATIGISNIYPTGVLSYIVMLIQQILVIPSILLAGYLVHTL